MAKDIGLFERETGGAPDRAVLLESADRFLELLGHPRGLVEEPCDEPHRRRRPAERRHPHASDRRRSARRCRRPSGTASGATRSRATARAPPPMRSGSVCRRSRSRSTATCGRCAAASGRSRSFPGRDATTLQVALDRDAFADLVSRTADRARPRDRRAGRGRSRFERGVLRVGSRAALARSTGAACTGPATSRLRALDGSPLELDQRFRLGDRPGRGRALPRRSRVPAPAGRVHRRRDGRGRRRPRPRRRRGPSRRRRVVVGGDARPASATRAASSTSPASRQSLRALLADPRFLAIGELLGDGHRPGDPFGEHFAEVTAEGLVKRVDSVEGLVCLPWHKDCERGGHSMFCSGLTVGICLTPVDEAHGGLDVVAGSHRANIARAQVDRGARPAARHAPRRPRRPHRAHVVRAAPVDPSREPRAARRLHGLRAAARARATATPTTRNRACAASAPRSATRARVRGSAEMPRSKQRQ